jgi:pentatricopeptide repeat protein
MLGGLNSICIRLRYSCFRLLTGFKQNPLTSATITRHTLPCFTAAARLHSPSFRSGRISLLDSLLRDMTSEEEGDFRARKKPPIEVLSLTDALFSRHLAKDAMLCDIKKCPILSPYFRDPDQVRNLAEHLAYTESSYRAHRVLALAHQLGCRLKPNIYEGVAFQFAGKNRWRMIPPLVTSAKRHTGRSTIRLLNWHTRALVEKGHFAMMEKVLDLFARENVEPNRRTFHLLVNGHLQNKNLSGAKKILRKMEAAGYPVDASTHALVVSVCQSLGPDADVQARALAALRDVGTQTATSILNSLLRLNLRALDLDGALRLLSFFDQRLLDPDLSADPGRNPIPPAGDRFPPPRGRRMALDSASSSDNPKPVLPDTTTFTILINYMTQRKDLPGALRMVSRMTISGLAPDSGTVAAILRAFIAAGDHPSAVRLVASMCDPGQVPPHLFNRLAPAMPIECDGLPIPTSLPRVPITAEFFNKFLPETLDSCGLYRSIAVLRIMKTCGIRPDSQTSAIFMRYLQRSELARPRELIRLLRHLTPSRDPPTLEHLHIIFKAVFQEEKHLLHGTGWNARATKFARWRNDKADFPEDRISGTSDRFHPTAGIRLSSNLHYRALISRPVQSLISRGVRSDRAIYALRIRHDAVLKGDLAAARKTFGRMIANGIHPNEYHFTALMEGHVRAGDFAGARGIMQAAVQAGLKANAVMYTILIAGHARRGDPDSAMRVFRDMIRAGVKPDPPSIDAVASAYYVVGAYRMAKRTLIDLWPFAYSPTPLHLSTTSLKQLSHEQRALTKGRPAYRRMSPEQRVLRRRMIKRLILAWKTACDWNWGETADRTTRAAPCL